MIQIVRTGPLCTVQDRGRAGYAAIGVSPSGAADRRSLGLANRLVGNAETAACLEITLGGLALRARRAMTMALTGAPVPSTVDGRAVAMNSPFGLAAGALLVLGVPRAGLRTYLAVRGGIDVPEVLGSRSTDVLSGLGTAPLRSGTVLSVGRAGAGWPNVDVAPVPELPAEPVLRVLPGPRDDWFTGGAVRTLGCTPFDVTPDSNRVGIRLHGPVLERARHDELPSEGMVRGALQVPPDGRPMLFLADHPVTGGYPVIGVVVADDLPLAAQLRPGQRIRFRYAPGGR